MTSSASSGDVTITVCPDGPLLVRGPARLVTVDGEAVDHSRNVIALCRCGRSRLKPLCDGSHRTSRFSDDAALDDLNSVLRYARPLSPDAPGFRG